MAIYIVIACIAFLFGAMLMYIILQQQITECKHLMDKLFLILNDAVDLTPDNKNRD